MGLFDRFKKHNKQKVQQNRGMYSMSTFNDEEEIMVFNVEKINSIRHRGNELTDLIMARITKQNKYDTIYVDYTDYITFEIPKDMEVTDEIMNAVMREYQQNSQQNYIGRLINDRNNYIFGNRSATVQNVVNQAIEQKIQQKREHNERKRQEKQQEEENKRKEFLEDINARTYLEKFEQERNRRKKFPRLEKVYSPYQKQGNKTYSNYDGVNLETGDVLRIRQVDKVGKDASGTYLYSAYIYNTPNEHDVEMFTENPLGVAVCFELQKRLEDIVNDGDTNEIRQILQLLSDGRNFENPEQLNYIGEIDKNGQANRREKSSSSAIQAVIVEMQRKYEEEMQEQQAR